MSLDEYMRLNDISLDHMAKQLGIAYMYVSALKRGVRRPSKDLALRIELITGGQVTMEELRRKNGKKKNDGRGV